MAIAWALVPFRAARIAVVVSALAAPLLQAALLGPQQPPMWLSAAGVVIGVVAGRLAPAPFLAALIAIAPVWQLLLWWATGSNDFNLVMPWLGAVAGCLAAAAPMRWHRGGWWMVAVSAWALVVAATWPVTAARELDFTIHSLSGLTGNGRAAPPPRGAAAAVAMAAEIQLVALLLFDWMVGAADGDRRRVWRWLTPGIAGACVLAIWQMVMAPTLVNYEPWIRLGRAAGPFWDANAVGALAALFGPMLAVGVARRPDTPLGLAAGFWILVSLGAVLASGSRTALAAWALTASLGAFWQWRRQRRLVRGAAIGVVAVGMALATVSMAVNPFVAITRLTDTARRAAAGGGMGVLGVLWDRDGYGPASVHLIAEHPWAGIGPGTFNMVILDDALASIGVGLPPDNAQNWWRHQWAELGLLGAAAGFFCSGLAALTAWRLRGRPDNGWALPILSLGLMSCVSSPVQHPLIQVFVGLLLAGAVVAERPSATGDPTPVASAWLWGPAIWIAAGLCATTLAVEGRQALRPPYRAVRFGFPYDYGFGPPSPTASGDARWAASRAVGVFAPGPPGQVLVVRVTVPREVTARGPVQVTLSDRRGRVCDQDVGGDVALECRVEVTPEQWTMVQIDVGRPLERVAAGAARAALVTARFEPRQPPAR